MTPRAPWPLKKVVLALRRAFGDPPPPVSRDPFQLILFEQVAYLVPDARRLGAFRSLRRRVGVTPRAILATPEGVLRQIAREGGAIAAPARARRMIASAELVERRWGGQLTRVLRLPLPAARRALAAFAMIGEPGADKILAQSGAAYLLPLDSNALRVLLRIGLINQGRDYRRTYQSARDRLADQLVRRRDWVVRAGSLLRRHGQEICRSSVPQCPMCPLRAGCRTGRATIYKAKS